MAGAAVSSTPKSATRLLLSTVYPLGNEPHSTSSIRHAIWATEEDAEGTTSLPAIVKASPTEDLDRSGGIGDGGGPSLVASGGFRTPCPSCGDRCSPDEIFVCDGTDPNCGAGGDIRSATFCGAEAPGGCL